MAVPVDTILPIERNCMDVDFRIIFCPNIKGYIRYYCKKVIVSWMKNNSLFTARAGAMRYIS